MQKISLIITGVVALFSSSLALAAMEQNTTKWYDNISANVAVDVAAEIDDADLDLDKGLSLGADYTTPCNYFDLDIVLGGKYFAGRNIEVTNGTTKFSGLVLDASIKKSWSVYNHNIYALAGVNVAAHLDIDLASDTKNKTKADGVGFQVGVGYQINNHLSVELVQEELKSKYAYKDDYTNTYSDYTDLSITATSLAVNYSF